MFKKLIPFLSLLVIAPSALAQVPTIKVDDKIPGYISSNYSFYNLLNSANSLIGIIVSIIVALSILLMILGGFSFITAKGDEGKITTAKNYILWGVVGIAVIILSVSAFWIISGFLTNNSGSGFFG